jgi:hypothetical protein
MSWTAVGYLDYTPSRQVLNWAKTRPPLKLCLAFLESLEESVSLALAINTEKARLGLCRNKSNVVFAASYELNDIKAAKDLNIIWQD